MIVPTWIDLSEWPVEQRLLFAESMVSRLAMQTAMSREQVLAALGAVTEATEVHRDGPCHCRDIPWKPHKHRYELDHGGLR